jgi:O-acetyl-ADP-ribose deacetylase (regulator of RNase III)
MNIIDGDLIALAKAGQFDVIVHGCNCFCTMGAGIAKLIKEEFPAAYTADLNTKKGCKDKLGSLSYTTVEFEGNTFTVVNAYTQYDYKGKGPKVDYDAIRKAFAQIKDLFSTKRIGFPAIGAGLAGGDWEKISIIIEEELEGEDFSFVRFNG